jgi:hypothetical protein
MEDILAELKGIKQLLTTLPPAPVRQAQPGDVLIQPPAQATMAQANTAMAQAAQAPSAQIIPMVHPGNGLADFGSTLPPTLPEKVVTDEDITSLIQPHLNDPALKAGFQGVLQQMGIPRLPEAKPEQYAELHARFSAVIAQSATVSPSSVSII